MFCSVLLCSVLFCSVLLCSPHSSSVFDKNKIYAAAIARFRLCSALLCSALVLFRPCDDALFCSLIIMLCSALPPVIMRLCSALFCHCYALFCSATVMLCYALFCSVLPCSMCVLNVCECVVCVCVCLVSGTYTCVYFAWILASHLGPQSLVL